MPINAINYDSGTEEMRINNGSGNGRIVFQTISTERARVDSSGRLLIGTSSALATNQVTSAFQVAGAGVSASAYPGGSFLSYTTNDEWPVITVGKSNASLGVHGAIGANNTIGQLTFEGSNGSAFRIGASITAINDQASAWGASDCLTRLVFGTTADGASSPTERMRITSAGYLKASNTGTYNDASSAGTYHEFMNNVTGLPVVTFSARTASFVS